MENTIIASVESNTNLKDEIILTEKAITEVKSIRIKNNIPLEHSLRVAVKGGGCSGFTYMLEFDESTKENDHKFIFGDINVVVDPKSMFFVSGITIDFSEGLNGKGFVFNNPQATKTCGCGSSFGV